MAEEGPLLLTSADALQGVEHQVVFGSGNDALLVARITTRTLKVNMSQR